jgi:riboflavin synthase
MFTGIVEELGTVAERQGSRLRIEAATVLDDVQLGASIAVNGCCLTVVAWEPPSGGAGRSAGSGGAEPRAAAEVGWWEADLSDETLLRTNLGRLRAGDPVNLERPVRLADRLGGHLVQGHVDTVAEIVVPAPNLQVRMHTELLRYIVEKGSVTVDGVSLTVVKPLDDGFTVAVIPHTAEVTTLGRKGPGDTVNLEVDVMAKYAERLLEAYTPDPPHPEAH